MAYKQLTPASRGQELLKVFDLSIQRLQRELEDGKEFNASTIRAALDLLNFARVSPRIFIDHPRSGGVENGTSETVERVKEALKRQQEFYAKEQSEGITPAIAVTFAA